MSIALAWLAIWPTGRALADPDLPQARRTGAEEVKMAVLSTARFDVLWHFDFRDGNLGQRSAKNRATGVWPRTCGEKGTFFDTLGKLKMVQHFKIQKFAQLLGGASWFVRSFATS